MTRNIAILESVILSAVAAAGNPVKSDEEGKEESSPVKRFSLVNQRIGEFLRGVNRR
ncbi:MAG: hypothetical protein HXS52_07990 [Theionarchaea archaeon]|nr:hypothetical protein [Theionarchaea archaeon]MBU7037857.1 hypothetical protein [Theionarchaea archaeon]